MEITGSADFFARSHIYRYPVDVLRGPNLRIANNSHPPVFGYAIEFDFPRGELPSSCE